MFSQWLTDHQDELLKFVSGHHHQHDHNQQQLQTMQQQNHELLVTPPAAAVLPSLLNNNNNIIDYNHMGQNYKKPRLGRRRMASSTAFDDTDETPADYLKKIIHRDVERQRRQEMSALYQSLRSQIPSGFLQGKRSISDHIHGAIRYIGYMQKRRDELKNKRDRLKELLNPTSSEAAVSASSSKRFDQTNIAVKPSKKGMQITFSTVLKTAVAGLSLSKVLNVLVLEGMSVKSCISAPVHQKMLHIIEIEEVNEERRMDPSQLEGKLMSLDFSQ